MDRTQQPRVLAQGKFLRLLGANGWEWVDRVNASGAAVIVAVTEDQELVLVEQYRIPLGSRAIELPAGLVGDEPGMAQEKMIDAARRELFEETGYEASRLECLTEGPSSAGLTTELYSLFLARNARKTGAGGGDAGEDIQVHVVPIAGIEAWLEAKRQSGVLIDTKIYAGLYFAAKAT